MLSQFSKLPHQPLLPYLKSAPGKTAGHGVSVDVCISLLAVNRFLKQPQHSAQVALLVIHSNGGPSGISGKG